MEMSVAYDTKYREDPTLPYSLEMIDRAIRHNNIVIAECNDQQIREKAIWNAMICCRETDRYEEALKYAEMFPPMKPITRNRAIEKCLQGGHLIAHRQMLSNEALSDFCLSLSKIYWFAEQKDPYVVAALDTEEAVLKTVFPDGNYLAFHANLCCAYQKRAEFEIIAGEYDKAMEYLQIMIYHAKQIVGERQSYTCGVFDRLSVDLSHNLFCPI